MVNNTTPSLTMPNQGNTCLLSTSYFAPIAWYQALCRHDHAIIESCDSYYKQTYRNRCIIATANATQTLTVPVERDHGTKQIMRDIRISDHGNWRHVHWNALQSAYNLSPFFEYYADDIRPFFEKRWTYLIDFNLDICQKICELLDIQPSYALSQQWTTHEQYLEHNIDDLRGDLTLSTAKPYYQVFAQKHGFQADLSILDLLFNMGNEAVLWL